MLHDPVERWGSQLGETASGTPLQLDEQPTNGITYASVLMDVSDLQDRLARAVHSHRS